MENTDVLSYSLYKNEARLREVFGASFDILYKITDIGGNKLMFVMADGMCDNLLVSEQVLGPILKSGCLPPSPDRLIEYVSLNIVSGLDQNKAFTFTKVCEEVLSGLVCMFVDGVDYAVCFGVQGFPKRNVDEAQTEVDERASHEAFCENFKDNAALLRRRIRSPELKLELITAGTTSKTRICICYLEGRAKPETIELIKKRIENSKLDTVFGAGYIGEFLSSSRFTFFPTLGTTERPDIAAAKMAEGRILIITDGTPFAIIAPYLFSESFQTMDDYSFRPFYAAITRLIKYTAFFISVFLPSIYIAVCTFHHEILPVSMLYDIAVQEAITPFPVMFETMFIHFVYEIVREAGVRMPKAVGNAVSIVGALVIGQAAVDAGLIAAPMLIIMALSAISSFIVPSLYQSVVFLRFAFMTVGGVFGFYGIVIGFAAVLINSCWASPYGVPLSAPVAPFSLKAMRDTFLRFSWKELSKRNFNINSMER